MANAPAPPPPPPAPAPPMAPAPPAPMAPPAASVAAPAVVTAPAADPTEEVTTRVLSPAEVIAEARAAALDTSTVSQANAALGLYGDSGSGKTEQCCQGIEYNWETFHKISHVYAVDLGGFGNHMIRLIKLGIAKVYAPRNHVEPFETAELISMGYFPETILDPVTGYADPYVKLVPPQIRRWTIFCPNGHGFAQTTNRKKLDGFQQQCPTCGVVTSLANWAKVEEQVITSKGFKHVGLRIYDSGTSMQDWVMEDLAGKAANEEFSQGNALKGAGSKVVSGNMTFGSNSMQHFGFAQNRMPSWIANSRRIPNNAVPPIWTFLEQRGKDEGNIVIFGPKIAGNARTADVPAWLGNCLHLAKEQGPTGQMINRIWLTNHSNVNEGNIPHLAKHRGDAGTFPPYLQDEPDTPALSTCSVKYFLRKLDQALKASLEVGIQAYPDAPALVGLDGDDREETVATTTVSLTAGHYQSPVVGGPVAGVGAGAAMPTGVPSGVPTPPGMAAGVPPPPPMAAPPPVAAAPVQAAAGVPGPRPPIPQAPPVAAVAPPVATAPPAAVPAPAPVAAPAPAPPAAQPVVVSPVATPAAPAAIAPTSPAAPPTGAPVRPPATSAVVQTARAARPPVPPPPGQPQS